MKVPATSKMACLAPAIPTQVKDPDTDEGVAASIVTLQLPSPDARVMGPSGGWRTVIAKEVFDEVLTVPLRSVPPIVREFPESSTKAREDPAAGPAYME